MSDSLRNLFSHIENGQKNRILVIEHTKSKAAIAVLNVLQQHGYIRGYRHSVISSKTYGKKEKIRRLRRRLTAKVEILLKYKNQNGEPALHSNIGTFGNVYLTTHQLAKIGRSENNELLQGIVIVTTSKGICSAVTAHKLNVGGELIGTLMPIGG